MMDNKSFKEVVSILFREYEKWDAPAKRFENAYRRTPYTILISTLLSFQTKDEVTLSAGKRLFELADNPYDMVKIPEKIIADTIYPVGFWRKKAKSIKSVSEYLIKEFEGEVPNSFDKLIEIKGIGAKTAKIVLESAFGESVTAVDTHMHRILNILGYIDTKTPKESDKILEEKLPPNMKKGLNRLIVSFGQVICKPVRPKCDICPISQYCPEYKSIK